MPQPPTKLYVYWNRGWCHEGDHDCGIKECANNEEASKLLSDLHARGFSVDDVEIIEGVKLPWTIMTLEYERE